MTKTSDGFSRPIARRSILLLSIATLLQQVFGSWPLRYAARSIGRQAVMLLAPLRIASAAVVGQVVVASYPDMVDAENLVSQLVKDLGLDAQSIEHVSRLQMGERISRQVHNDFEWERTLSVNGWQLALTEARICALAAQQTALFRPPVGQ